MEVLALWCHAGHSRGHRVSSRTWSPPSSSHPPPAELALHRYSPIPDNNNRIVSCSQGIDITSASLGSQRQEKALHLELGVRLVRPVGVMPALTPCGPRTGSPRWPRSHVRQPGIGVTGVPVPASSPIHHASRSLALGKTPLTSELAPPSSWKKIKVSSGRGSHLIRVLRSAN